ARWRFPAPGGEAGCGGIDLYGGSFAVISGDQFQQLLRAVAANAPGYAFQLAIKSMCPECGEIMDSLQKVLQSLNQGHMNSCQLAQGIVNDVASAMGSKQTSDASLLGALEEGWGDIHEMVTSISGTSSVEEVGQNLTPQQQADRGLSGNLVWHALVTRNADSWFADGDAAMLEAMMSITGSVIVAPPQEDADGREDSFDVRPLSGNLLTVRDLLYGSRNQDSNPDAQQRVRRYRCPGHAAHQCRNPDIIEDVTMPGLAIEVRDMLLGAAGAAGIVDKFGLADADLTAAERAFLENIPGGIGAQLRNLARTDIGMARDYARRAAPAIAIDLVTVLINDAVRAVEYATAIQDNAYAQMVQDNIDKARQQINDEKDLLSNRVGNPVQLLAYYDNLIRSAKRTVGPVGAAE
ncbi:conjugal transfer protein TraH, partial [Thiohalocapsa sp.]|uniref:conjugal transfer protein TraH n=1 Tax=Thiohalocapsa sp. TaxID=2497641 RepID=UPI0025E37821